ncbi:MULTISPECIES: HlyD family type I secretion periplasmic adaptor subunit [unclassified Aminobacter]|uniref:HlyD family type I secretion periplasmic adaptor subunit n=1 Tax=unclassified Aminobacter TaxID=2644704 RepID=UPI00046531B4|nr:MULTISPECIES: HlyD family type I secretion periplasmic adaptor subunit [unclassified Aminobacter]TWG60607.1 HlyD family secretion protein [Aminobacter sp. J44]TWH30307.1 HlyD family secretion protein [Aminobacter sp. J15]
MSTDIAKIQDLQWYGEVPRSIRTHTIFGLALLGLSFGGFGVWAATAPLVAAVISQGSFVATGQNKIVQHFEGGIIKELMVNEGDQVTEGQPLVKLDETAALAKERELFLRRIRLEIISARLTSQYREAEEIEIPLGVRPYIQTGDPDIASMYESQKLHFEAARVKRRSELSLLEQNVKSLEFRMQGYVRLREAMIEQLTLLRDEHKGKKVLLDKGLLRATEVNAIQRAIAEAQGEIGRLEAEIAETGAQLAKAQQEIIGTQDRYKEDALDQLQNIQGELEVVREQSREAESVLRRSTIHAPVSGTVIRLHYHTPGGVIESGKGIMEILPAGVPLIIEAHIPRNDIDSVSTGQKATVRLTALNQRTTPVLEGEVFYVSADALQDERANGPGEVYVARISLPGEELSKIPGFSPMPGMPAEIMIQTAERTFFSYLVKPITDSMSRAFTEK